MWSSPFLSRPGWACLRSPATASGCRAAAGRDDERAGSEQQQQQRRVGVGTNLTRAPRHERTNERAKVRGGEEERRDAYEQDQTWHSVCHAHRVAHGGLELTTDSHPAIHARHRHRRHHASLPSSVLPLSRLAFVVVVRSLIVSFVGRVLVQPVMAQQQQQQQEPAGSSPSGGVCHAPGAFQRPQVYGGGRQGAKPYQEDSFFSWCSPTNRVIVGGIFGPTGGGLKARRNRDCIRPRPLT